MNTYRFTLFLILVSSSSFLFSQNYSEENNSEEIMKMDESTQKALSLPLGIDNTPNPRLSNLNGNSVFLKQVGDYNASRVSSKTNTSEISLLQNGNVNSIDLDYRANAVITEVSQNGDYNQVKDFTYDKNQDVSLELIQKGDGLYFERFGTNNITKSLKFKQTEASPAIIVRSFK